MKFDVRAPAPSEVEIHQAVRRGLPVYLVLAVLIPVSVACLPLVLLHEEGLFPYLPLCLLLVAVALRYVFLWWHEHRPLDDAQCARMLELCCATEEGLAYRKQVLAHARRFVQAELHMMEVWYAGLAKRESCKKLYNIDATLVVQEPSPPHEWVGF